MIALTQKMEMAVATPHEYLTLCGVPAQSMFVVLRGQLEMTASDGAAVIAKLSGGSCFNETALLTGEPPDSNVVAVSYCVLYMLRKPEFQLLEKEFKKTDPLVSVIQAPGARWGGRTQITSSPSAIS